MTKKTKLIKGIDQELWDQVKVWGIQHKKPIGEALNHIIQDFFQHENQ